MKKFLFLLFTIHCSLLTLFSQAPQSFNYQAVAWDNAGELMKSTDLTVRISILSEDATTGTLQWEETHSATTNEFGLFTLQIGAGTRTNGLATNFS
ncbi:MAG: hypothetical protein KAX05_03040, partial [Bacteroidales bacterium]|nr:hypothetical protein [Bacteroidales bacterium]